MGHNDALEQKPTAPVIHLQDFRSTEASPSHRERPPDFNQLMQKNRKNQERLKSERTKANLSVIRSLKK